VKPKLQEVAARAGVSVRTVSNVLNGNSLVAEGTRRKVQAVIDEVGYRPSGQDPGRSLTGFIALVVPTLDRPYFAEIATRIVAEAHRLSWRVVVEQTRGDSGAELSVLASRGAGIDGMILSANAMTNEDLLMRTTAIPIVLLGEQLGTPILDHVGIDNVEAARTATRHLISLGRRRIAAIGAQGPGGETAAQRLTGYRLALHGSGMQLENRLVRTVRNYSAEEGERAMTELLTTGPRPDAVFCFTDLLALGAIRALRTRHLECPRDVAIVGFDDTPAGRASVPSLSTIAPDKDLIARTAVELLQRQLTAPLGLPRRTVVAPFSLIPRESSR
jgi:DNA-binding LacI/PurR family transcriptional regulator